jgi:AbrB family looped-hinge helix DNA binding protein
MEYGFETGDYFAFRRIENGILVTKVADQSEEETGSRLRRMDDLGRIVIPRTMRSELNIREGDELAQMNYENGVLLVLNRIDCGL